VSVILFVFFEVCLKRAACLSNISLVADVAGQLVYSVLVICQFVGHLGVTQVVYEGCFLL
jgi:hypothetical protein